MELFSYLLKVSGCIMAFYLMYRLFFRKLTFFGLNRMYLLLSILFSLIIPILVIPPTDYFPAVDRVLDKVLTKGIAHPDHFIPSTPVNNYINWIQALSYFYWLITAILLLKTIFAFVSILYQARKKGKKTGGYYYIYDSADHNSSFFNILFLKSSLPDAEQIIAHEQMHCRLLHSADHLFTEITSSFLWFNPFIYFLKKELYQVHEFQADHFLIQTYPPQGYAELLLKLAGSSKTRLTNAFSTLPLKQRIQMLFTPHSRKSSRLLYLGVIPVLAMMLYLQAPASSYAGNGFKAPTDFKANGGFKKEFTLIIDAGHGGHDAGGISNAGDQEKDINLHMAILLKQLAVKNGIPVLLTRSSDEYKSLKNRTILKGNVFISLHTNTGSSAPQRSGLEMIYSSENSRADASYKLATLLKESCSRLQGITVQSQVINSHIYVLKNNDLPAVAIEMGNADYAPDLNFIKNKQKQQQLAGRILEAIGNFQAN